MIHQSRMNSQAMKQVQANMTEGPLEGDLETLINQEKGKIANGKSFKERMFSKKAAHGMLMFISWGNIAGRIFASNQSGDFTCHTYPVYKPVDVTHGGSKNMDLAGRPLQLVPPIDPRYHRPSPPPLPPPTPEMRVFTNHSDTQQKQKPKTQSFN